MATHGDHGIMQLKVVVKCQDYSRLNYCMMSYPTV